MKTKIVNQIMVSLLYFFAVTATFAQEEIKINLAKNQGNVIIETVSTGRAFNILIENRLLGSKNEYLIVIEKKVSEIEALTFPGKPKTISTNKEESCDFTNEISYLYSLTDEKEMPKSIKKIKTKIKKSKCSKEKKDIAYDLLTEETSPFVSKQFLNDGEQIEVTVSRKVNDSVRVWKNIYKAQPRGKWVTTYGFSFITDAFKRKKTYFLKEKGDMFAVTKKHREKRLMYVPTVFFTWIPTKNLNKDISGSWTGGLGFDLESPAVFLGRSWIYNQNINLTVGLSTHKQDFLKGEYSSKDEFPSTKSYDDIHDDRYVINPFISLAFRFGSPIFKTASSGSGD